MEGVKLVVCEAETETEEEEGTLSTMDPDTLISFSTTPGHIAFRQTRRGSDYVQTFATVRCSRM
jgi:hypothetical protein